MAPGIFRFDRFLLDPRDRQLRLDDAPVELNARYLDALTLLVREQGKLVSKDRFLEEVWRGVPVTDEALTQCIRTLRKRLGDDAGSPRFIETVPKHGYRFIAPVDRVEAETAALPAAPPPAVAPPAPAPAQSVPAVPADPWRRLWLLGAAGAVGGGAAGLIGGLIYGFVGAAAPGVAAASLLVVLASLCVLMGAMGGAGVGFGVAVAGRPGPWSVVGGAGGGLAVGAIVKLLGLDAFALLFGRSPGDITGGPEGALLGAAVGLGAWLGQTRSPRRAAFLAGLAGLAAGMLIDRTGGRLMAGSLDLLAQRFPSSRLPLDQMGALFGEPGFGPLARMVTSGLEGLLFGACGVAAMTYARRRWGE